MLENYKKCKKVQEEKETKKSYTQKMKTTKILRMYSDIEFIIDYKTLRRVKRRSIRTFFPIRRLLRGGMERPGRYVLVGEDVIKIKEVKENERTKKDETEIGFV